MKRIPSLNEDSVRSFAKRHLVETRIIDGEDRMFRKSPRNLDLLHPDYRGQWTCRGSNASEARHAYADSVLKHTDGKMADGGAHRVKIRFNIDVPYHPELEGDTLRVWMPFPREADRQCDIEACLHRPARLRARHSRPIGSHEHIHGAARQPRRQPL